MTTKHIYLGDNRIASQNGTTTLYYHSDHLGSSNVITDSVGKRVQLAEYKPFGELKGLFPQGTVPSYYFTGKELDTTGLYYYGARYYDPAIARFITPDNFVAKPYNPQYLNRYSYCLNNPLRYIDPTGNYPGQSNSWGSGWSNWWSPFSWGMGSFFSNTYNSFNNNFSSFMNSSFNPFSSGLSAGIRGAGRLFTMDDFLPNMQRGVSGALSALDKTSRTYIGSSQWYIEDRPFLLPRNIVQGIGLAWGAFGPQGVFEPYYRIGPDLTINQAQTIASMRALKLGIASAITGLGTEFTGRVGQIIGGFFENPFAGELTGRVLGSIIFGEIGIRVANVTERFLLNWFGLLYNPYYQQN